MLTVKLLNGELTVLQFPQTVVTLFDIWHAIWDLYPQINRLALHTPDMERVITLTGYNSLYDFNKSSDFVSSSYFERGCSRKVDLSVFSQCSALCLKSERRSILVYVKTEGKEIMLVDVNDPSFHFSAARVGVRHRGGLDCYREITVDNEDITFIDVSSFLRIGKFRAGSRVFETTIEKIEQYLVSVIPNFQPSYIVKVCREDLDSEPVLKKKV